MKHLLLLSVVLIAMEIGKAAITLSFPTEAIITGNQVMLTEVAKIDANEAEMHSLVPVSLGAAPILGQSLAFSEPMIRMRLRQYHINPDSIIINCPKSMRVTRFSTNIGGEAIVAAAEQWLKEQAPAVDGEELIFTPRHIPEGINLPNGNISWLCEGTGVNSGSVRNVVVTLQVDGKPGWRGTVTFSVRRIALVLVLKTSLRRGQKITDECVTLERRDISNLSGLSLRNIELIAGCRSTRQLKTGDVLVEAAIESSPLIKRNDKVRVQTYCGALIIATTAIACEDGKQDAIIHVRNPQTKLEYNARITGVGEAEAVE